MTKNDNAAAPFGSTARSHADVGEPAAAESGAPGYPPAVANDAGGSATRGRLLRAAANDDGVSPQAVAAALAAVAAASASAPVGANDDGPTDPPTPAGDAGVERVPTEWRQDDPHVVHLSDDIRAVLADPASDRNERRVAVALLSEAEGEGEIPSYGGEPAIMAFRRRHGLPSGCLQKGHASRALFDRFAPRFRLEAHDSTSETRSGAVFRAKRRNVMTLMRDLLLRPGLVVPANGRGSWSIDGVAPMLGVEPARLRWNVGARALLNAAVADGRAEVGAVFEPAPGMSDVEHRQRIADLKAIYDGFDVPGGKVPESPLHRGYLDWEYCASLTGTERPTGQDIPEVREHAMGVARRRGLMLPGLMVQIDNLAALRTWGLERIAEENKGKPSLSAIVSNHKVAFDRLVREGGLTLDDEAGPLFAPEAFDAALARTLAGFDNPRSAANVRRAAAKWRELHAARVGAAALPDDLPDALDTLLGSRGITQAALAAAIGEKPGYIRDMILGGKAISTKGLAVLAKVEVALELAPGTLIHKAGAISPRPSVMDASPEYRALPRRMRPLLPVEAANWPAARLAAAVRQVEPVFAGGTAYGQLLRVAQATKERMPAFDPPPQLAARLAEYRAYKEAPVTYPLLRARNARWASPMSADMGMKELGMPFRFAAAPVDGGTAAGLGVPVAKATLGWLAHAPFALALFGQRSGRFADLEFDGVRRGRRYTVSERHLAAQLLSMTNPVTGFLAQMPELAWEMEALDARLAPEHADLLRLFGVAGEALILTEEDVMFARRDWRGFVTRAHQVYLQAVTYLDNNLQVSRDPFAAFRGLAEAAEPQAELLALLLGAQGKWADERTSPLLHRLDVRNSAMCMIAAITAFRPGNLTGLTFTADGRGQIRKVDGTWEIEVDYRRFKNYRNSRLFGTSTSPRNYRKRLRDEAGLYDLLDRYFFEARGGLRGGQETAAAFIGRMGDPVNNKAWYDVVRGVGREHIAHNPVLGTGFPGVVSFNPYAFRHLRASDVLKNGKSYNRVEEAALALQTSESMVRKHYGVLLPEEAASNGDDTFGRAVRLAVKRG